MAVMRQTHIITPSAPGTKASRHWGTAWSKREPCCIRASSSAPDDLLSEVDLQAQARGHELLLCSSEEATHFSRVLQRKRCWLIVRLLCKNLRP